MESVYGKSGKHRISQLYIKREEKTSAIIILRTASRIYGDFIKKRIDSKCCDMDAEE